MKKVVIFGATGGLGNLISKRLVDYDIINLGSSDVDITDHMQVNEFFKNNLVDIVINFAGVNFDKFAHKLTPNDKDIINNNLKMVTQTEKNDFLQEVIKNINQRNYQIRNAIEWKKFTQGV